jgi:tetratricopeptide (TPR) repeat protein
MAKKKKNKKRQKNTKPAYSRWIKPLLIISASIFLAYFPVWDADFVYWDDDVNVYENQNVQSLSAESIKRIFSTPIIGNYNPLPILSFAIEHAIFGMDPSVMHITNLLLHVLSCLLVYFISLRLKLSETAALIVALLFALHPMRVESVAWITERKDVLFAVFFWLSFLFYLKSYKQKRYFYYALMIFPLALLSKIQAVSLPLALLCADYILKKKFKIQYIVQKWPFFLLSLITGIAGIYFLKSQGSLNPDQTQELFSWAERPVIGAYSFMIYLYKLVFPYPMSPLYPYPAGLSAVHYLVAGGILPVAGFIYYLWSKNYKTAVFSFAFFIVNVIFVLQVVGAGQGFIADRFTYIGYFGFFFWAGSWFQNQKNKTQVLGLSAFILFLFAIWTFQQAKVWKNSDTMWSHVLQYYPNSPLALGNRGNYYRDQGNAQKAEADYSKAIQADATRHATYNSRAKLYFNQGKLQQALQDYNQAIKHNPDRGEYYGNRGATYARLNRFNQALEDLNKAIQLDPNHAASYLNRGAVNDQLGNIKAAQSDLKTYLSYNPNQANIWYNYALTSLRLNDSNEALTGVNQAIQLNPNSGEYYKLRAKVYIQRNQISQARQDASTAAQMGTPLEPNWQQRLQ